MSDKIEGGNKIDENLSNKYRKNVSRNLGGKINNESQKYSAIVIALLIMVLLLGFVALAVTRKPMKRLLRVTTQRNPALLKQHREVLK